MTVRGRGIGPLLAWVALLAAAAAVLELAGGALSPPPLRSPSRWGAWVSGRDPAVAAFSVVRLVALGFAWYALAVTVAGAGARLLAARLAAGVDRVTLPPLRRVLAATMSVGLGSASLAPAAAGAAPPRPAAVVADASTTTTVPASDSLTMRELAPDPPPASSAGREWTVRAGECFWSIAEDVLASALGRRPDVAEVVSYWRRLIDANRPALADRDNPDLVFPGQVFSVPDPP